MFSLSKEKHIERTKGFTKQNNKSKLNLTQLHNPLPSQNKNNNKTLKNRRLKLFSDT